MLGVNVRCVTSTTNRMFLKMKLQQLILCNLARKLQNFQPIKCINRALLLSNVDREPSDALIYFIV